MTPEGELHVALRAAGGRVAACELVSSRPDIARLLLEGRRPGEVQAVLPRLFSLCGVSQATAGALALQAAAGALPDAAAQAQADAAVLTESLRVGTQRVLLEWPRLLGEKPEAESVAALRGGSAAALAQALFGQPAPAWLALNEPAAFDAWVGAGATLPARLLREAGAAPIADAPALPQLQAQGPDQDEMLRAWAARTLEAPAGPPLWQGGAAETGPWARLQGDALVQALGAAGRPPAFLRLVARLRELACQLAGRPGSPLAGALCLGPRLGLGWVENTRGLLLHLAELGDDRVMRYRIVAPTDWNFHPRGALALSLLGLPATDAAALQRRAQWEVASLDPCVACCVELSDA